VSLRVERLPYLEDSALLFAAVRDLPWPVFLDSGRPQLDQGRYDIIAAAPFQTLTTRGPLSEIRHAGGITRSTDDPFQLVRKWLALAPHSNAPELPFHGGAIGYFAYDLGRRIERLPAQAMADEPMPELAMGLYDWALVIDHSEASCWLVSLGRDPATTSHWQHLIDRFKHLPEPQEAPFRVVSAIRSNLTRDDYQRRFEEIQAYILEGDCYQVNFAQRFAASVEGDTWTAYQHLRKINPAPFSAFLETPFGSILCTSPERFLRLQERQVQTCPIKGTARRQTEPEADRHMAEWLSMSEKDRAENLMIVDLLRNDLGKVCLPGSITVTGLFEVQSFAKVHHLVSTIEGRLAAGEDALSLLRACFPGGSITGAPKLRAMQIIEELEGYRRGVYCGAIGYLGFDGRMDTNIAIRTLVVHEHTLRFWAGGGIVFDSDSNAEYQETFDKAAGIFDLLNSV
jgi:para-aminobenzoate synthetase component 1